MVAGWEIELKEAAKEYEEKYGESGKVWLPAGGRTYRNIWHAAQRRGMSVDELIKEYGYTRVKTYEHDKEEKLEEIKEGLKKEADKDRYVRVDAAGGLYKKIYNLARREKCTVDDIIEKCGYIRVRCSKFDKEDR